jgi:outer membrane protein TolC
MKQTQSAGWSNTKHFWKRTSFLTACASLALAFGCTVTPEPLSDWERAVRVDRDVQEMFGSQRTQVVSKPISLYDAMARALKYNLDARLKLMDAALAEKQYDLSSLDMLPQIAAGAGYAGRNKYEAVVSKSMETGVVSTLPYAYGDKTHGVADLQVTWNVLDFGVSYFQAKQDANSILIAGERRRKVVQSLLQEVRVAYWQALAAERLTPKVDDLMEEATFALENAREVEKQRLKDPSMVLNYQMTLMETMRDLSEMKKELLLSRDRLSALMNLKPGTKYRLIGPEQGNYTLPEIRSNLDRLEWLALMNRPELREEDYQLQNTRLEAKKSLLKLLPNLNLAASANYDSDEFLSSSSWIQAAVQLGWNLLNPMYMEKTMTMAQTKEAVDNLRRQTIAMAVLTQTHIGWGRYQGAKETYQLSVEISDVAGKLAEQTANASASDSLSEAEQVTASARALFAELRTAMNFAELQEATGNMFVTIGVDPLPEGVIAGNNVESLSRALERVMGAWDMGRFTNEDYPILPPVPMRRPPVALNVKIPIQKVTEDNRFVMTVEPSVFAEAELGRDVTYAASMRNGAKLPPWMFFDARTLTLSGKPLPSTEGMYEIKITARNKKKMSAYITVVVQVMRGFKQMLDLRGADPDARVTVIERCRGEECNDYPMRDPVDNFPNKVIISPIPHTKR